MIIMLLTIIFMRIFIYFKNLNIFIGNFEVHHFHSGIVLLSLAFILTKYKKRTTNLILTIYAISFAFIIDELEYILRGFQTIEEYNRTIYSTSLLFIFGIMLTTYNFYKSKNKKVTLSNQLSFK